MVYSHHHHSPTGMLVRGHNGLAVMILRQALRALRWLFRACAQAARWYVNEVGRFCVWVVVRLTRRRRAEVLAARVAYFTAHAELALERAS